MTGFPRSDHNLPVGDALAASPHARERRRCARRGPADTEPLARLRLRTGRELGVIDLSNSGALVEGPARLLPGTHVDVHIVTRDGRVLVRSRIVRAFVCHVASDEMRYRGALAFDRLVDTTSPGYAVPEPLLHAFAPEGTPYPAAAASSVGNA